MRSQLQIDTYFDITCYRCGKSWSTDFNARNSCMDGAGMGMATDKIWLRKVASKTGWKCKQGLTLCPECVLKVGDSYV